VPELHPLETWSDARAFDGTATVMQPLIAPLYQGWSAHEVLAALGEQPETSSHNLVKGVWQRRLRGDAELAWRTLLHDGVVANTSLPARHVSIRPGWANGVTPAQPRAGELEIVFRPDAATLDGRYAHNGWLIELPRPFTRLSWDNVALMSPATAGPLGVVNEDVVELRFQGRSVRAPVWVLAGQADGSVGLTLGYGRRRGAAAGNGVGFDANALRSSSALWFGSGLEVVRTGERYSTGEQSGQFRHAGSRPGSYDWPEPVADAAGQRRAARGFAVPAGRVSVQRVGHGHRPERVYRLQRVHRCLPGREQHSRGRQGGGRAWTRYALAPTRHVLRGQSRVATARAVYAV
jgi:hypothetical protein